MQPAAKTFMDLLAESRVKIYKEVFTKMKVKQTATWPSGGLIPLCNGRGFPMEGIIFRHRFSPCHPLALLAVNKVVSCEAGPIAAACPFFIELSTRAHSSEGFKILPLPEAAKRQIRTISTYMNGQDIRKFVQFCNEEQYPNL